MYFQVLTRHVHFFKVGNHHPMPIDVLHVILSTKVTGKSFEGLAMKVLVVEDSFLRPFFSHSASVLAPGIEAQDTGGVASACSAGKVGLRATQLSQLPQRGQAF